MVRCIIGILLYPKKTDDEKITFFLLNVIPLLKYLWEGFLERHNEYDFAMFNVGPTWDVFFNALTEEFYHVWKMMTKT